MPDMLPAVPADVTERYDQELSVWELRASELEIQSQGDLDHAGAILHEIKELRDEIGDTFDPIIKAAHEAHRAAVAQKKKYDDPLKAANDEIRGKVGAFHREEERKAREQAALEEAQRREAEQKARREAEELAAAGEHEQAAELEQQAEELAAPAPVKPPAKTKGVTVRESWAAECTDLKALVDAVAAGKVPLRAVQADTKVLGQMARSLKSDLKWPGVRVWNKGAVAVR